LFNCLLVFWTEFVESLLMINACITEELISGSCAMENLRHRLLLTVHSNRLNLFTSLAHALPLGCFEVMTWLKERCFVNCCVRGTFAKLFFENRCLDCSLFRQQVKLFRWNLTSIHQLTFLQLIQILNDQLNLRLTCMLPHPAVLTALLLN
jgi:hypothetical protein